MPKPKWKTTMTKARTRHLDSLSLARESRQVNMSHDDDWRGSRRPCSRACPQVPRFFLPSSYSQTADSTEKKTTTMCNPHPQSAPPTPPTIPRSSFRSPYTWLPESCRRITSQRLHHATSKVGDPTAQLIIFPQSIPKPSPG